LDWERDDAGDYEAYDALSGTTLDVIQLGDAWLARVYLDDGPVPLSEGFKTDALAKAACEAWVMERWAADEDEDEGEA
jgi:hypothetical protein